MSRLAGRQRRGGHLYEQLGLYRPLGEAGVPVQEGAGEGDFRVFPSIHPTLRLFVLVSFLERSSLSRDRERRLENFQILSPQNTPYITIHYKTFKEPAVF